MKRTERRGNESPTGVESEEPQFHTTQFDYHVAELAWREGLSSNSIVEALRLEKTPQNITKVRRALERAVRNGLVQLNPPVQRALEDRLHAKYPEIETHVALSSDSTCQLAATIVKQEIEKFLELPNEKQASFVVANAGGRTVRDTINYLHRLVPLPPPTPQGKRLLSLSLNAAEHAKRFDECANSLAVRLAEIYMASHFAVIRDDPKFTKEYLNELDRIDFMVSSVGATDGLLNELLEHYDQRSPKEAVGDIAFHLIDSKGHPVELSRDLRQVVGDLHPSPSWHDLSRLFRQKKVLVVLRGAGKVRIARALFENSIITRCVLDLELAHELARS